jgi:hypothetical protein
VETLVEGRVQNQRVVVVVVEGKEGAAACWTCSP